MSTPDRAPASPSDSPPALLHTPVDVGVVDVLVIRPLRPAWRVLVLQRAEGTRCPGSWETVHGRIEPGERPEHAALREVREETGLTVERLYHLTVQPFYLHATGTVQLAVVFAAFVTEPADVLPGPEHRRAEWLGVRAAARRFAWPREREALAHARALLAGGDAGAVEDVLRVF
jgi:dATP pyrophosphohydrolase